MVLTLGEKMQDLAFMRQGQRLVQALWLARQVDKYYDAAIGQAIDQRSSQPIIEARQQLARFMRSELFKVADWFYRRNGTDLATAIPNKLGQSMAATIETTYSDDRKAQDDLRVFELVKQFTDIIPTQAWAGDLFNPPTFQEIAKLVNFQQMRKKIEKVGDAMKLQAAIVAGITDGKGRREIGRELAALTQGDRVAARRVARTEVHRVAQRMVEKSINDVAGPLLKGYRYVATLDARTRSHHANLDGKEYKIGQDRPVLPNEPNCRCTYTPVLRQSLTKKFEPLQGLFTDAERASIDGPTPAQTTYKDWFNRQSKKTQVAIIGKSNYNKLNSSGDVTWQRFARIKNSPARKPPRRTQRGRRVLTSG